MSYKNACISVHNPQKHKITLQGFKFYLQWFKRVFNLKSSHITFSNILT